MHTPSIVQPLRLNGAISVALLLLAAQSGIAHSPPPPGVIDAHVAPSSGLVWDSVVKEHRAQAGESTKLFTFEVSNPSTQELIVESVAPSCGCTVVKLPPLSWTLQPGEHGRIQASMDWSGRFGLFTKTIAVKTSVGVQMLTLKIEIPAPEKIVEVPLARARNLLVASGDRQAVFKNDCARCHAQPAAGKTGEALYAAACAICHEAAHRATMVPDLQALSHPTDRAFWRQWAAQGRGGSLMPAFAQAEGGPLSEAQLDSLADYLAGRFSGEAAAPARTAAR